MRRRIFCASAVSALTVAAIPWQRALAVASTEVPAMGTAGKQIVLKPAEVDELRASLRGVLLTPGQEGYDTARKIWNGAFDRKPALIARCAGAADVTSAVNFARTHELLVAVRGGGHSLSGQSVCDGGMMIDLSPMKGIRVDPVAKTARVEPGVLLGQFDREAQAFGLATTAGTVSHTGAAGLTLGGGFGRIGRKYGLACDNMSSADVVTADGRFVKAGMKDNPDLLWGLRGGGGNFGVVTSFEYQLHTVTPLMYGGALVFPYAEPRDLLRSFADFIAGASDDLYVDVMIVPTPNGQRAVVLDVCHSGSTAAAEKELAKLRKIGKPLQDGLRPTMYVDIQRNGDDGFPTGRGYYIKSGFVKAIEPKMIDACVDYLDSAPFPAGVIGFSHHGGAIGRVKQDATAFWHREANHSVMVIGFWNEPGGAERSMQWSRTGWKTVEPLTDGFYVNEMSSDDTEKRIRGTYGANYTRLAALKKQYDPMNLFRMNANIKPA
ncbi:MAG TPA: FAD-binding oxidoreductase [Steroidobacteraceae bacterium]|nr:FAD-binding oxidoreductase [Steroidobacteraceae bacterium]